MLIRSSRSAEFLAKDAGVLGKAMGAAGIGLGGLSVGGSALSAGKKMVGDAGQSSQQALAKRRMQGFTHKPESMGDAQGRAIGTAMSGVGKAVGGAQRVFGG